MDEDTCAGARSAQRAGSPACVFVFVFVLIYIYFELQNLFCENRENIVSMYLTKNISTLQTTPVPFNL